MLNDILRTIYILLCIPYPGFICFLPVIVYDTLADKRYILCIIAAAAYLLTAGELTLMTNTLFIISITACIIIQHRTAELSEMRRNYIRTRDNSVEITNNLNNEKKQLIANQDYEIHLATLKERNRIAREIHDNVGHMLSRSILQLGALQVLCRDEVQSEGLKGLSETLNNAMTSVRQSVHDLHDDSVDMKLSVTDAVSELQRKGIDVHLKLDCSDEIPNNIKFSFIGIVKEAVSNIIKHSNADSVEISLIEHPAFYKLTIDDNGRCSGKINNSGIGLENMRERINSLGGIITLTADEKGFRIFITVKKG